MPRLAPKLTILAALVVLTLPACSSNPNVNPANSPTATSPSPTAAATGATSPATPTTSPTATSTATGAPSAAPVAGTQITISKFLYSPVNLQVKPGATITVVNQDPVAHTVTSEASSGGVSFDSKTVNANASGSFTAPTTPGTYPYTCTFHPQMHGTLTVSS